MKLLEIIYGIFLFLISITPIFVILIIFSLIKKIKRKVIAEIQASVQKIKDQIASMKANIEKAKNEVVDVINQLVPFKAAITTVDDCIEKIEQFTGDVVHLKSEAFNLVNDFIFPVPVSYNPNFIRFKTVSILHHDVIIGLSFSPPFTFSDISLQNISKDLEIPGLQEVKNGFEELNTLSNSLIDSLKSVLSPFNFAQNLINSLASSIKNIFDCNTFIIAIEKEITNFESLVKKLIEVYLPKIKIVFFSLGILLGVIYLHWLIKNIITAVNLIF